MHIFPKKPDLLKSGHYTKAELNGDNEPKPAVVIPNCPGYLDPLAKRTYRMLAREMKKVGTIAVIDGTTLAQYCSLYSRLCDAETHIQNEGVMVLTREGNHVVNKWIGVANTAMKLLRPLGESLGFSAAARSKLKVDAIEANTKSEMNEFMSGDDPPVIKMGA